MDLPAVEKGDPVYDSEDEEDIYFRLSFDKVNFNPTHEFKYLKQEGEKYKTPAKSLKNLKRDGLADVKELFNSEDFDEFVERISSHDSVLLHYALVKKMIELSMDKTDREREMVSKALIELQVANLLPFTQLAKAFERLLETIDDLSLDIPAAPKYVAQFIAKAVADDVLPPAFLMDKYIESLATSVVQHAKVLLSMKHGLGRLERVWGVSISSSVDELKDEIKTLLLEYFNSTDCGEVARLLKKMNVPFFHHELVKRAVLLAVERKQREQAMVSVLLKLLVKSEVVSTKQLQIGFQRLYKEMEDIKLDNPNGHQVIDIFSEQSIKDGCLTREELAELKENAKNIAENESKMLEEEFSTSARRRADSGFN